MADQARKQTDKILNDMEKEVWSIYDRASADISAKWYKYMESHEESLKSAYDALQEALKSGDDDAVTKARSDYERVVKNVTLNNDRYKSMLNETTAKLSHTNEVALDYVNGNMAKIYTLNYNEFANQDITGYTFTLVNEQAVKNLATEDKSLLPKKKVDIPKDKLWNQKNINSEVLQGILQGENITKIADRLQHVTDMNRNSSIRNARTMVTSAENKGRQDSFKKAESDGVIMKRRWVATHDDRTRAAHEELDGVEVDLDEPWENEYGEIMYPGDPSADPANVYNCRCSIRSIVKGFKWNEEVEEEIEETNVVQGKDLSETWERRPDEFDLEIEDVINAQGFDGLPKVVDAEEFDRYVEESNFIAQRTYSAPDQETLDAYREQLYNGKWYVDRSSGGAAHGKGMYCVGEHSTEITERMKDAMISYGANSDFANVETFTLKDAKVIKESDIKDLYPELGQGIAKKYLSDFEFSNDEIKFLSNYAGLGGNSGFVTEYLSSNRESAVELMKKISSDPELSSQMIKMSEEYIKLSSDQGVVAAMLGYDAIDCGETQGYFVILNRTKCIFKGE